MIGISPDGGAKPDLIRIGPEQLCDRMQYTIRNVPDDVDLALRRRARASGKSLNETVLVVLRTGLKIRGSRRNARRRDFSFFSMSKEDARVIEQTHAFWDRTEIDSR